MSDLVKILDKFKAIFDKELFRLGETPITLITIIYLFIILLVFFIVSKLIGRLLRRRVLSRLSLDDGSVYTIARLFHYGILVLGILFGLDMVGIGLTSLTVAFGLIGVGLAFGLQNITSNFVSGIILLFERPVSVGDFIEVGDAVGRVKSINVRATTVITPDNITLIVPNSQFVQDTVTNWSVGDLKVRINITVGVAYGSDTELVTSLLLKAANEHPKVMKDPPPSVLFTGFGDSSLNFKLRVWIPDPLSRLDVNSNLNYAIDKAFRDNNVTIPFPQRDLHIFREE